jgi:hypothetical protein
MEATVKRKIEDGNRYNSFFPKAQLTEQTVKRNANVAHTVAFIPKVVKLTKWHTEKIAQRLKGKDVYETCRNIWHFVYQHIAYQKDEDGMEQVRSPARAWHDRHTGIDCDCYTVFISSILSNLNIAHTLRITKYKENYFQHIYPIVPLSNGQHITMDCVVHQFNYEEPYSEKQDTPMDLQFLNGVPDDTFFMQDMNGNIFNNNDDLGKLFNFKKLNLPHPHQKIKVVDVVKKGLHLTNRINPKTVLLRIGVLASMKLNVFKVPQRLKYAYLTDEQAKQMGIIPEHFHKLKLLLEKIQTIFYAAGGKEENLKKAILTGRGNRKHEIRLNGLDGVDRIELAQLHSQLPLHTLLGNELFYEENNATNEVGELGEPVTIATTTAAMTAASGIMASISVLIKSIGSIFPKKEGEKDHPDFDEKELEKPDETSEEELKDAVENAAAANKEELVKAEEQPKAKEEEKSADEKKNEKKDDKKEDSFWEKNKTWVKPTAAVAGGLTLLGISYLVFKPKPATKTTTNNVAPLQGLPKHSPHKKNKTKKHHHVKAIALM